MITAAEFDRLNVPIRDLYEEYNQTVLNDIARRLKKMDMTTAAAWQMQRLIESGRTYQQALDELAKITGRSRKELAAAFKKAGVKSIAFDDAIYKAAGLNPLPFPLSNQMINVLMAGIEKTGGIIENMTKTTALAAQNLFIHASTIAYMQVSSGAFDYNTAIKNAIKAAVAQGLKVEYPTGHIDHLDVAVRRAVLTGVAQTTGQLQITRADEMGQDLVQTSAHFGARNKGDVPENHEMWQGRVFSRSGLDPDYPSFLEQTGYGTGAGLCGWNCRHSFYPFFKGMSVNPYSDQDRDEMARKTVPYKGQQISQYEASQIQRGIERGIRKWKREAAALAAGGIDNQHEVAKVHEWQAKMRDFVTETGLNRQPVREGGAVKLVKINPTPAPKPIPVPKPIPAPIPAPIQAPAPPVVPQPPAANPLPGFSIPNRIVPKSEIRTELHATGNMAELIKSYTMDEDPNRRRGVFESHRVKLSNGQFAIMKPDTKGYSWNEAAASDVDKLLGLEIVPDTIFDEQNNASFQLFVGKSYTASEMSIVVPGTKLTNPEDGARMALLDGVIGNVDRHGGNWLITHKDSRLVAIDHGLSFKNRTSDDRGAREAINDAFYEAKLRLSRNDEFSINQNRNRWPISIKIKEKLQEAVSNNAFTNYNNKGVSDIHKEDTQKRAKWILDNWDHFFRSMP